MALEKWAIPQLSKLIPLDEESLKQVVTYSASLPKDAAAEHLKNLLGDSAPALEFISTFNTRRQAPANSQSAHAASTHDTSTGVPKPKNRPKKKKDDFNKLLEIRRPDGYGNTSGGYIKKSQDDYISSKLSKAQKDSPLFNALALQPIRDDIDDSLVSSGSSSITPSRVSTPKLLPSGAGRLISDSKPQSRSTSQVRNQKTKITITGGTPMHGKSAILKDLDSAIRELEMMTNPSLALTSEQNSRRKCRCMAQKHPLLEVSPNCLNCGKIICVKEGLGPCTFCNTPLLSNSEIQSMIRVLREERGREKQEFNNAAYRKADVSKSLRPFSKSTQFNSPTASSPAASDSESELLSAATQHRDKLLAFQAQNARRTRIHDEAADFETTTAGLNIWATPVERAMQLKKQQKILREQEWNARPEWEKRKIVASIDLVGGKVVRHIAAAEQAAGPESEEEIDEPIEDIMAHEPKLSNNPLLGSLIRPVAKVDVHGKGKEKATDRRKTMWRRVQDDNDDNEQWILDGGL
ncbi:uncharacterized protein PV09_00494 [Verruconis gallopava]|uniref:TRIP4/RQT4 C2HC5-type zinc finger domain-containing protein n=1 Tax=Verruconis gallopava TaxID=253628 RepID=A0A0D1Z9I1_9PEZI|nr:uncharacterized protein PV09_00494 [Verruconis gallopava]KIW09627.1 hypothetical protein PV09_00494 [Verruconis gallopava]